MMWIARSSFIYLLTGFTMCGSTKTLHHMLPAFDKEGHRGCRGLMPENTIPAMLTAVDLGVTTLEMDAVITGDKNVILSHEPWFGHEITTKPDGTFIQPANERDYNIYRMTYDEVRRYDVGLKPHPRFPGQRKLAVVKPLLKEVIKAVENYVKEKNLTPLFYNIETKSLPAGDHMFHPPPAEFVDLLMQVINQEKIADRVIIQSFDFRTLQYLHQNFPNIKTAMLIEDYDRRGLQKQLNSLGFVPTIYSPHYSLVDKDLVDACRERNIKVIPWTANDHETISRLKSLGVDGIISDYPNLF